VQIQVQIQLALLLRAVLAAGEVRPRAVASS